MYGSQFGMYVWVPSELHGDILGYVNQIEIGAYRQIYLLFCQGELESRTQARRLG